MQKKNCCDCDGSGTRLKVTYRSPMSGEYVSVYYASDAAAVSALRYLGVNKFSAVREKCPSCAGASVLTGSFLRTE